jgi:hypothetical protein
VFAVGPIDGAAVKQHQQEQFVMQLLLARCTSMYCQMYCRIPLCRQHMHGLPLCQQHTTACRSGLWFCYAVPCNHSSYQGGGMFVMLLMSPHAVGLLSATLVARLTTATMLSVAHDCHAQYGTLHA